MASNVPFGLGSLSTRTRDAAMLAGIVLVAILFRFWHLGTLPPGLRPDEARLGLSALQLLHQHDWLSGISLLTAVYTVLLAASVELFGHTTAALRAVGALFGVVSVFAAFGLVQAWFDRRTALVAALLVATSPWSVTLSRNVTAWTLVPAVSALTLWALTLAWKTRRQRWIITGSLLLVISWYIQPVFWLLPLMGIVALVVAPVSVAQLRSRQWLPGLVILAAGLLPAIITLIVDPHRITKWFAPTILGATFGSATHQLATNIVKTLAMFNLHGDDSWLHNVSGQPMLNVFVGIMFILGVIVALVQIRRWSYRLLVIVFAVGLGPALIITSGAPDAERAALSLIPALAFASIGISYMLDRWYITFPINAAARSTGWGAMVILLALSSYQGYVQYFTAWAGTSEIHDTYDEAGTAIATFLVGNKFSGQRVLAISPDDLSVVSYLDYPTVPDSKAVYVAGNNLASYTNTASNNQFVIDLAERDTTIAALKNHFGGGKLYPHYSPFNNAELFYIYEVSK